MRKKYNYRELDIIAEPYFDVYWNEVYSLTDTGRRWNVLVKKQNINSNN